MKWGKLAILTEKILCDQKEGTPLEQAIHVCSEIGRLRKVLLHRPGGELENLMPEYLERLLFDDIPYLEEARREHDAFAD